MFDPGEIPKDFILPFVLGWTLNATGTPSDCTPSRTDPSAFLSSTVSALCRVMNAYSPSERPCLDAASIFPMEGMNFRRESYMVSPTFVTDRAGTFSPLTFLTQFAVGHSRTCDIWSRILLLTSSAIRTSYDLHPDSRWARGTSAFEEAIPA